jgi:hypothetical protein
MTSSGIPVEDPTYDDDSGEICVACGGPHFDCTDPANDDYDEDLEW